MGGWRWGGWRDTWDPCFVSMSVFPVKGHFQRHQDPAVFRREALNVPWESFRVSGLVDWGPRGTWPLYHCTGYMCVLSRVRLCATLWTLALQGPLSMGSFRQEYYSELPLPPPGHLPNPGSNLRLLHLLHCTWILYPQSHSREPPSPHRQIVQGAPPNFSACGPFPWGGSLSPARTISPPCSPSPPVSANLGLGPSLPFP